MSSDEREEVMEVDEDIDDEVLDEEGTGGSEGEEESEEEEEEEDEDEEAAEAERMLAFVADMPDAERGRLREVVWAQSPGFKHWPAFVYHPGDVNDELRARLYKGKGNEGPKTHHIVFYYNFGTSAFAGVPFKSVLPWTDENMEALTKVVKQYKAKLPGAIEAAGADGAKPKDERNPGPPDVKAIRKQEREAQRAEREEQRRARQAERRAARDAAKKERRAERKRRGGAGAAAGGGKKKRKTKGGEGSGGGAAKKAKADFSKETEEERFDRLSRNLEILLEDGSGEGEGGGGGNELNVPKICSTLDKLAAMRPSISQLTATGVGQLVKDLRRHAEAEIQAKAKHTFGTWKQSLASTEAAAAAPAPAPQEAAGKGKEKEKEKKKEKKKNEANKEAPPAPPAPKEPSSPARAAASTSASATTATPAPAPAPAPEAPAAAAAAAAPVEKESSSDGDAAAGAQNGGGSSPSKASAPAPAAFGGSDDGFADMDEAKKRQRARGLLKQVLAGEGEGGGGGGGAAAEAGEETKLAAMAEQAEGLVFAHRKGRADEKYLSFVRGLCHAVKGDSHGLRARLLRGEIEPALGEFFMAAK